MWIGADTEGAENSSQIALSIFRDTTTNQWFVDRVEFNLGATRTKTSFAVPQPVEQAFTPAFLEQLKLHLPASHDRGLIADADVHVPIAHLSLVGIRVAAQTAIDGIQKVWVRFMRAFGSVQALLLPRHRTEHAAENALHSVAAMALLDLLLPCLDMLRFELPKSYDDAGPVERVQARLETLQEKRHDLEFYVGLFTRYLAHRPGVGEYTAAQQLPRETPEALKGLGLPLAAPIR
ncbi:hypothetical protein [Vannielia litorea]|uniref:hypothetical protein n=1 Tax=Vannielia litorea TaxID=1217970 RepID=UPI001C97D0FE|nr:hypothetical protein [Vannielia litorea]MBY6048356.1 hypothetical protein [Vannielia litorea]MBY6075770.1 hypothetical protein [Vannielia litorea]